MAFELHEGEGSLFSNDRKVKPSQPDYTGKVMCGGRVWRLAGWKRMLRSGGGFLSLRVNEDQQATQEQQDLYKDRTRTPAPKQELHIQQGTFDPFPLAPSVGGTPGSSETDVASRVVRQHDEPSGPEEKPQGNLTPAIDEEFNDKVPF